MFVQSLQFIQNHILYFIFYSFDCKAHVCFYTVTNDKLCKLYLTFLHIWQTLLPKATFYPHQKQNREHMIPIHALFLKTLSYLSPVWTWFRDHVVHVLFCWLFKNLDHSGRITNSGRSTSPTPFKALRRLTEDKVQQLWKKLRGSAAKIWTETF